MKIWTCLAAAALALSATAMANSDVVFRCTDARGEVTVQDTPCPSGTSQIIQRRGASAASTASTALGDTPAPAPAAAFEPAPGMLDSDLLTAPRAGDDAATGEAILDSDMLRARAEAEASDAPPKPPLPPMFRCSGRDTGYYLHEQEPAPPRCATLSISGLGGSIAPENASSCEVVRDDCIELQPEQRCGAWQQRLRDLRGRERFAAADTQAQASSERQRVQAVIEASDCAVP